MYKMLSGNSRKTSERVFKVVTDSLKFNRQTPYLVLAQKLSVNFESLRILV